ncbi:hypothetical protein B0H13DRAFT_1851123 [Mycena leptocephala]|nr:hypothetical protein B0H13DRAFT_1851123 [Mycena leptocephala]
MIRVFAWAKNASGGSHFNLCMDQHWCRKVNWWASNLSSGVHSRVTQALDVKVQGGRGKGWDISVPPKTSTLPWEVERYTELSYAMGLEFLQIFTIWAIVKRTSVFGLCKLTSYESAQSVWMEVTGVDLQGFGGKVEVDLPEVRGFVPLPLPLENLTNTGKLLWTPFLPQKLPASPAVTPECRINPFRQTWSPSIRSLREPCKSLFKTAQEFDVKLDGLNIDSELKNQIPIWFHFGASPALNHLDNSDASSCLRDSHKRGSSAFSNPSKHYILKSMTVLPPFTF